MTTQTTFQPISCAELAAMEFPLLAPEPAHVPTWGELVALEPKLADVERLALSLHKRADNWRDWATVKQAFLPLVGWTARRYALRNSTCYDVVYGYLLTCWETGRRP